MKKWLIGLMTVLGLAVAAPSARAVLIAPGGSTPLTSSSPVPTGGTVLDSIVNEVGAPSPGSQIAGTLSTIVYKEAAGTLDFIYQLQNTTALSDGDWFHRVTVVNFNGYTTDVSYAATADGLSSYFVDASASSTISSADRSNNGNTVGFTLETFPGGVPNLNSGVAPGGYSYILVVKTNATQYYSGGSTFAIDGGTLSFQSFTPSPAPSSLALLGAACFTFAGAFVWRRRRALALTVG
jgi:hypothetical protein